MRIDPDLVAVINPALREFADALAAGEDDLCVTFEVETDTRVWLQVSQDLLNVGLLPSEGPVLTETVFERRGLAHHLDAAGEDFVTLRVGHIDRSGRAFVYALHDLLARGDGPVSVEYSRV